MRKRASPLCTKPRGRLLDVSLMMRAALRSKRIL